MVWGKLIWRNFGRFLSCGANRVLKNSWTVKPVREAGATAKGPPPGGRKGRVRRDDQVPRSVYSRCALWGCPAGCSTCRRACSRVASARRRSGSASAFSLSPFFGTPSRTPHNRTPRSRPKGLRQKHQAVSLAPSIKTNFSILRIKFAFQLIKHCKWFENTRKKYFLISGWYCCANFFLVKLYFLHDAL